MGKINAEAESGVLIGSRVDENKLARILKGELSPEEMTADEQAVWRERMVELLDQPTAKEEAFFAELAARGDASGMDEDGQLFPTV